MRRFISLKKLNNQISFLKSCISEQVVPVSFGHVARPSFEGDPFPAYAHYFIKDSIAEAKIRKEDLLLSLRLLRSTLRSALPDVVFEGTMD